MENAKAVGLWTSIRALLIAVIITVLLEIVHIPGRFTSMTVESLNGAFKGLDKALTDVFNEKDVSEGLDQVSANLGDADQFNTAAIMEPRLWKCPWKKDFLLSTCESLKKVRADMYVMRLALLGHDGKVSTIFKHLNTIPESRDMQLDLSNTVEDARELAVSLLEHDSGIFTGLEHLDTVYDIDQLDGLDAALDGLNKHMKLPEKAPETMEDDELVQLSIVFVMLEFLIAHVASIIEAGVALS